jgi:ATP-dependent Clp protease ATP-binding subunit ClpB
VRQHFRPELLNRIDEVIIFNPLGVQQIAQIVEIQLRGLRRRLEERKIRLELTDRAKAQLAQEGFDPVYGARPLKRTIQKEIVQPLAMRLLQGEFRDGDTIVVDSNEAKNLVGPAGQRVSQGGLVFRRGEPAPADAAPVGASRG